MTSSKKGGGLAAFAVNTPVTVQGALASTKARAEAVSATDVDRQRGKGAMVSLTVRVSQEQWRRIHELAVHEGKSINALSIEGITRLFQEKGLPAL